MKACEDMTQKGAFLYGELRKSIGTVKIKKQKQVTKATDIVCVHVGD